MSTMLQELAYLRNLYATATPAEADALDRALERELEEDISILPTLADFEDYLNTLG